jgi:hypothetical protein
MRSPSRVLLRTFLRRCCDRWEGRKTANHHSRRRGCSAKGPPLSAATPPVVQASSLCLVRRAPEAERGGPAAPPKKRDPNSRIVAVLRCSSSVRSSSQWCSALPARCAGRSQACEVEPVIPRAAAHRRPARLVQPPAPGIARPPDAFVVDDSGQRMFSIATTMRG